ncbi:VOC family protein [Bartonella apis]|uniref:VOC family protein n=1 Tax=Bartonella apis TaxID=1686310 RepID=UPI00242D3CA4|nr:VOC family protein [Bartonella apis]
MMFIDHIDHIVMTCFDLEATKRFYTEILELKLEVFGENRFALRFGNQKINLHQYGKEYEPKAHLPVPGSLDLCFISKLPIDEVITHLKKNNCPTVEGPVERTGAKGKIRSVYVRDPDLNLIEISEYLQ